MCSCLRRPSPVFVDVDPRTGNIDPDFILRSGSGFWQEAEGTTPGSGCRGQGNQIACPLKAALVVDVFGQLAEWDQILKKTRELGLRTIEDSCEALGANIKGRKDPALSVIMGCLPSTHKQITTGEGGVIVTNDAQAAALMRALRNQARSRRYLVSHTYLDITYRLDEMSAALRCSSNGPGG